jgi:hypothetical protein
LPGFFVARALAAHRRSGGGDGLEFADRRRLELIPGAARFTARMAQGLKELPGEIAPEHECQRKLFVERSRRQPQQPIRRRGLERRVRFSRHRLGERRLRLGLRLDDQPPCRCDADRSTHAIA